MDTWGTWPSGEVAGLSDDGPRWALRNAFLRTDAHVVATVDSLGGWLDLVRRKLVTPPLALLAGMRAVPRTADDATLPASITA